jgi:Spy/CpxP family protein refolding chaperone
MIPRERLQKCQVKILGDIKMLRYSLVFLSCLVIFIAVSADVSFAQPSQQDVAAESQTQPQSNNRRRLPNVQQFPPKMITVIGRSFANSIDKGVPELFLTFQSSRNKEVRKALGITDDQAKQIETQNAAWQMRSFTLFPELMKRFDNPTEDDLKSIQKDIENEFQKEIAKIDTIITPEQRAKSKELIFQMMGGLDSPLVNKDALDILNLTGEQRKKAEEVIDQMKIERNAKFEELMKLFETVIEKSKDCPEEELNELRKKIEKLGAEINVLGKKAGNQLKGFLNEQQRQKAEDLIVNAPEFAKKFQRLTNRFTKDVPYIPNANSWQPGQDVPDDEKNQGKTIKKFPRNKSE